MAKRTLKSVEENLIAGIKQAVVDIDAGETDAYMVFRNNGAKFYLINMIGSHSLLYSPSNGFLVLAWGLRTQKDICDDLLQCSWGNGIYFNAEYPSYIDDKYDWDTISKYVIDKI